MNHVIIMSMGSFHHTDKILSKALSRLSNTPNLNLEKSFDLYFKELTVISPAIRLIVSGVPPFHLQNKIHKFRTCIMHMHVSET